MKSNKGNNLERINIVYIRNVTLCHIVTLHALYSNLQIRVLFNFLTGGRATRANKLIPVI